ncbi:helix-turn-helix domain-containing protein [Demequina litorisediminis]|nr:XRE family transcriptional regulator [Demequina litorisediminis]
MPPTGLDPTPPAGGGGLAVEVGLRARQARTARGLSLGAVAAAAGIGKGSLSEIENGMRNPTLSTLYALAHTLDMPLSALLAERAGAQVASPGIVARLLDVREDADATVEVFALALTPGAIHRSDAHGSGVMEQIIVTAGCVRAGTAGEERAVSQGEMHVFPADGPHSYEAIDAPAHAVNIIRTPRSHRASGPRGATGSPT